MPAGGQLFVIDPIERLKPAKDSSVALMEAVQRAGRPVWICTPADLCSQATAGPRAGSSPRGPRLLFA